MARTRRTVVTREAVWANPVPVSEWMTAPAVTIASSASVREAVELMRARKIRHLPVVEEDGRLVGIVTDRDLRQMLFDPFLQDELEKAAAIVMGRTVREVMTWGVQTVRPDMGIRQAARLMHEWKIGALPVVQAGRVLGVLTERDVLRAFEQLVRERTATIRPIEPPRELDEFYEYGFPPPSWSEPWTNEGTGG